MDKSIQELQMELEQIQLHFIKTRRRSIGFGTGLLVISLLMVLKLIVTL